MILLASGSLSITFLISPSIGITVPTNLLSLIFSCTYLYASGLISTLYILAFFLCAILIGNEPIPAKKSIITSFSFTSITTRKRSVASRGLKYTVDGFNLNLIPNSLCIVSKLSIPAICSSSLVRLTP